MADACKTVRIKHEPSAEFGKPVLEINESDFDPEIHELYEDDDEDDDTRTVAELKAAAESLKLVVPHGAKKAELLALVQAAEAAAKMPAGFK